MTARVVANCAQVRVLTLVALLWSVLTVCQPTDGALAPGTCDDFNTDGDDP
jgi:hypothetical protein